MERRIGEPERGELGEGEKGATETGKVQATSSDSPSSLEAVMRLTFT
jgi:hypothetical protein